MGSTLPRYICYLPKKKTLALFRLASSLISLNMLLIWQCPSTIRILSVFSSHFFTDQQDLIKYLFSPKRYSPEVRPNAGNGPVAVTHRYNLFRLVNFVSDKCIVQ